MNKTKLSIIITAIIIFLTAGCSDPLDDAKWKLDRKHTPLTANIWISGSINHGSEVWYSITANERPYIWWNDSYSGDGTKTADIQVKIYYGHEDSDFWDYDSAWVSPERPNRSYSGRSRTIYLRVTASSSGTFAIAYTTSDTKPGGTVPNPTYTITYRDVGGGAFSGTHGSDYPTVYTYGTNTNLVTPTKTGYFFVGWFTNSDGTGNYLTYFSSSYARHITLYAKWMEINTYTITYRDVGGGNFSGTHGPDYPTTHTVGTNTTLVTPTKAGYYFNGWFINSTGMYSAGSYLSAGGYTADITLYAKWTEINTYTITYRDVGGGTFSGTHCPDYPTTHTYGTNTTLVSPTKTGYFFNGWFRNSTGMYSAGSYLYATDYTADITLYAKWTEINTYTITYRDVGGGTFSGTHGPDYPTTHTYGTNTTLVEPTKTGYYFDGWFINSDDRYNVTYLSATGYTANITLYAKWTAINTYTITYRDVGGGAFSGTHGSGYPTTHTYGTNTDLVRPTKAGYYFDGWFVDSAGTASTWGYLSATGYTANITLYAKWTEITTYAITYRDVGGGTFSGTHGPDYPTTHTYGTNTDLVRPTKAGYYFNGWFTNSNGTGSALSYLYATDYTADITLYAKWTEINTYTITYRDVGGGTFSGTHGSGYPTTHTYGTNTTLVSPTKTGYFFNGWFRNSTGTDGAWNYLSATGYTANITLYAKWTEINTAYTITNGQWTDGTITNSVNERWYSFSVTSGTTYYVWWNDSYNGNNTKTLDVRVSAQYNSGSSIFTNIDSAWDPPVSFTASSSGTVYVRVESYNSGNTGTFAIAYGTSSTRP